MTDLRWETVSEDRLGEHRRHELRELLGQTFPGYFDGRICFKQLPHWRVLAWSGSELVGQIGIDHRVIRVGGRPVSVFGLIDLAVLPEYRSRGIGSALVRRIEERARSGGVPYVILFADDHRLYERLGFVLVDAPVTYTAIDEHNTLGIRTDPLGAYMMVRSPCGARWPAGPIDLLGYLF